MKKKRFIIISLFVIIGVFNLTNNAKAFGYCNLIFFETDKEIYYNDEAIKINASWDLQYDSDRELSFIQIQIYNDSNDLLWNSSQYSEIGIQERYWTVSVQDLDHPFTNYSNIFYVIFHYYWINLINGDQTTADIETIQIEIIKRNVSCELINFTNYIKYGEILNFKARFYNTSLENNYYLVNELILFKVIANEISFYKCNFTTNSSGMIEISISTYENLTIGKNNLIFTITDSKFYRDSTFEYEITVENPEESNSVDSDSEKSDSKDSKDSNKKSDNSFQLSLFSFISILVISLTIFLIIYYNYVKKARQQNLLDSTFKY